MWGRGPWKPSWGAEQGTRHSCCNFSACWGDLDKRIGLPLETLDPACVRAGDLSRKTFLLSASLLPPFSIFLGTSYSSLFFLLLAFSFITFLPLLLLFKSLLIRNTFICILAVYPVWWSWQYNKWPKETLSAPCKGCSELPYMCIPLIWLIGSKFSKDFLKAKLSHVKKAWTTFLVLWLK